REEIGGKVIVRTGRRIPGVVPLGGVHAPISIVRMAVGDAYGAEEWREGEGDGEVALRTERIERRICHAVAEYAFRHADRTGAKVFGGPKFTVSPTYEGMLKEEMDAAAERHPDVQYEPQLIDATFALLVASSGAPLVIPALNRDGDILSDLVLPLFGSIAGSESLLVAFDDDFVPSAVMAEAAHGTAPSRRGKAVAHPMAMILAGAALLALLYSGLSPQVFAAALILAFGVRLAYVLLRRRARRPLLSGWIFVIALGLLLTAAAGSHGRHVRRANAAAVRQRVVANGSEATPRDRCVGLLLDWWDTEGARP